MLGRWQGPQVPIGAHVERVGVLAAADELGADCMQIFLSDPGSWRKPPPHPEADEIRASPIDVYVHAPYLINVCSPKPNVRYGSRKILQQTCDAASEVGAAAVIVHGGHAEDDIAEGPGAGCGRSRCSRPTPPVLLENTAGGDNAVARRFDALARLWEAIGDAEHGIDLGFCFDTCHAHAAGEELDDAVERVLAITGADRPAARQRLARPGGHRRRPPRAPRRGQDRRSRRPARQMIREPGAEAGAAGRSSRRRASPPTASARPTSSSSAHAIGGD